MKIRTEDAATPEGLAGEFMTAKDVTKLLKVTTKTLYRWRCAGRFTGCVKVGNRWLYRTEDVKRIAEHGTAAL